MRSLSLSKVSSRRELVLLLNFVRAMLVLGGLLIADAFRRAYDLQDMGLIVVAALILFIIFCVSDFIEDAMISYFNRDETS